MNYDFEKIVPREGTNSFKYDMRKNIFGRADVLPLWVADHDYAVPPCVTEAIVERATRYPLYGYEYRGDSFNRAVIDWVKQRNGWEIEPEWIVFTPGVVAGFVFGINAFSSPSDGIVIQPPVYPPFARSIADNGRVVVNNLLKPAGGRFEIDFDDLDRRLAGAKALILCNPHNPTGRVFTPEELTMVGNLCVRHNVHIISDEIHSDLVLRPNKHTHIASLSPEFASRTVTLIAPSKTFNLAGLGSSVAIIPDPNVRRAYRSEIDKAHVGMGNAFGNVATEAAYRGGGEWLSQFLEHIAGNVEYVRTYIERNIRAVKTYETEGTYLLWLDMSGLGLDAGSVKDFVVNKAGLGLNDGREFGPGGEQHMRMNVAAPRSVLEQAMEQLREACEGL